MALWAALHREDGTELVPDDAPGYARAPYDPTRETKWPTTDRDGWGWVFFVSLWTEPVGGECVSEPPLQPVEQRHFIAKGDVQ